VTEAVKSWDGLRSSRALHLLLAPHGLAWLVAVQMLNAGYRWDGSFRLHIRTNPRHRSKFAQDGAAFFSGCPFPGHGGGVVSGQPSLPPVARGAP
jgi:hypothetical protein